MRIKYHQERKAFMKWKDFADEEAIKAKQLKFIIKVMSKKDKIIWF